MFLIFFLCLRLEIILFRFIFRAQILTECSTPPEFEQMLSDSLLKSYQSHDEVIGLHLLLNSNFAKGKF